MLQARGVIFSPEAYAQGKMLDNSEWQTGDVKLPRLITPSDIDVAFDNNGALIFGELSRGLEEWRFVNRGQRLLYQNAVRGSPHIAVICSHSVEGRQINTRTDIDCFQIMLDDYGYVFSPVHYGNDMWQRFIFCWFRPLGPLYIRRKVIEKYGGVKL